jgi:hypothetical protein
MNDFIKHDGYLFRIPTLLRILHQYRQDIRHKKLVLELPDGEPISFTALDRVLEIICCNHGLTCDQILCRMVDHYPLFQSDWCRVETYPTPFFQETAKLLRVDLCRLDDDAKLFGAAYGRFTSPRLLMAHFLDSRFANDAFVIFQPGQDFVEFEMAPAGDLFQTSVAWAKNRTHHENLESQFNGCVSSMACTPIYHELFCKYRIEVVIETNTFTQGWFTEKTAKCLAAGKPFLLYGTSGQLKQLRNMGFRTFADCIDETYDCVQDPDVRFDEICRQAICIHEHPQRAQLLAQLDAIAQWNQKNYERIIKDYYHDFSH